jgi:hypothetical protein
VAAGAGRGREPLCPSARPETPGAQVFGVIDRSGAEPRVRYLAEPLPATPEVLALLRGAPVGEVLRLGARCAGSACGHFDGARCSLGERLVQLRPRPREAAAGEAPIPPCALRAAGCRWFAERGPEVCRSCQWVVSEGVAIAGSEGDRARLAEPPVAAGRASAAT